MRGGRENKGAVEVSREVVERRPDSVFSCQGDTRNICEKTVSIVCIAERSVQNERGVQNYTHNTKPF